MSKNAGAYTVMHNAQSAVIRARQFTSKAKSEDERSYNQAPADGSVHQTWLAYIGTCTFIQCSLRTEKSVSVHYAWMIASAAGGSQSSGAQFMNSFGDFFWNGGTTGNKEHEVYAC